MTDRLTLRIQVKDCLDRSVPTLHSFFRTLSSPGLPLFMSSSFSYHVSLHTSGRSKLYWFVSVPLCPSATSKYNQGISVDTVFSFYLDYSNQITILACFIAPPPTPLPTPSFHTRSHQQTFKPYGNS